MCVWQPVCFNLPVFACLTVCVRQHVCVGLPTCVHPPVCVHPRVCIHSPLCLHPPLYVCTTDLITTEAALYIDYILGCFVTFPPPVSKRIKLKPREI